MNFDSVNLSVGLNNLLVNCAGLTANDKLLVVYERPDLGWWDSNLLDAISDATEALGIKFDSLETGPPTNNKDLAVSDEMERHDCTVFLARMGDQDRFATIPPGKKIVVCYARDTQMMASAFGRTHHRALLQLKTALDTLISDAVQIEVSCPLGTSFSGSIAKLAPSSDAEVSIHRFPLGVISPIAAGNFKGQVALGNYLTPTGSGVYEPAWLELERPVIAHIKSGRITKFEGDTHEVQRVQHHYHRIASLFGIDPDVVHSWHVGMHQGLSYNQAASDDPDRWANTAFNHPRFLHFHTCGNYAPGEICWMVFNQTIKLDGIDLWHGGQLCLDHFESTRHCLQQWPELNELFSQTAGETGLAH